MRTACAVVSFSLLAACNQSGSVSQQGAVAGAAADAAAQVAIRAQNDRWARYTNAAQADSFPALFTADAVMMPPNVPPVTVHDSIAARVKALMLPNGTLTLDNQSIVVSGAVAIVRGKFAYISPAQGKNPAIELHGSYMEHFHHVGDQWLIAENIWNTDAPPPPQLLPPPAAKK
jgi:ketosteroid isomerase-like protein